jgi:hypothetical protein
MMRGKGRKVISPPLCMVREKERRNIRGDEGLTGHSIGHSRALSTSCYGEKRIKNKKKYISPLPIFPLSLSRTISLRFSPLSLSLSTLSLSLRSLSHPSRVWCCAELFFVSFFSVSAVFPSPAMSSLHLHDAREGEKEYHILAA